MTQDVIEVAGLAVLFIGVARAIWVRWLTDDAPGGTSHWGSSTPSVDGLNIFSHWSHLRLS